MKETEETVTTIKTMAQNVETGKRSIEQTSKAFGDINRSIETTSGAAKEISVAAADQKKSIDAISESLDKISGIAADTSSGSTQSAEGNKRLLSKTQELMSTATRLASMSEKLQQTVGRFNVEEVPGFARKPLATVTAKPKKVAAGGTGKVERQNRESFCSTKNNQTIGAFKSEIRILNSEW